MITIFFEICLYYSSVEIVYGGSRWFYNISCFENNYSEKLKPLKDLSRLSKCILVEINNAALDGLSFIITEPILTE